MNYIDFYDEGENILSSENKKILFSEFPKEIILFFRMKEKIEENKIQEVKIIYLGSGSYLLDKRGEYFPFIGDELIRKKVLYETYIKKFSIEENEEEKFLGAIWTDQNLYSQLSEKQKTRKISSANSLGNEIQKGKVTFLLSNDLEEGIYISENFKMEKKKLQIRFIFKYK